MIDQQKAKEAYVTYVERTKKDDRIIGVILGGGRGKGAASENSDYDVILVTTDEGFEGVKNDYPKTEYIDSLPHSLSGFREHAKMGSPTHYDKSNTPRQAAGYAEVSLVNYKSGTNVPDTFLTRTPWQATG